MSAVKNQNRMTVAEYLAWEPLQIEKHEFYRGEVFSQAGASRNHNRVAINLSRELSAVLRGHPCEAFGSDMLVHIKATGYFAYPDATVVCPPIEGDSDRVVTNPVLVAEVLSPSTADFDRGAKFDHYRQIPSLREYLVLAQERPVVQQFTKTESGDWLLRDVRGFDGILHLASIGHSLKLSDLYEKVAIEETPAS